MPMLRGCAAPGPEWQPQKPRHQPPSVDPLELASQLVGSKTMELFKIMEIGQMTHASRLLVLEEYFPSKDPVPKESPRNRRSPALLFPSFTIMDGIFSGKSLSYRKLPSEPLRLSVLKLDGSCFDIVVTKAATIAELRQAVEDVFSHMPKKGPGKISWPHVWGQFCLCYDGQKLVTETDNLRNYGIKDGEQVEYSTKQLKKTSKLLRDKLNVLPRSHVPYS
ncbi:hypothetical protein K1719_022499 [Acacia pycnantha]|nr:hypothetical protein K1719_022499 [Acacia pycnantha]